MVRVPDHPRAEKEAEDLPPPYIVHKDPRRLVWLERATPHIPIGPKRAVPAVIRARIGKKGLKEDRVPAVWKGDGVEPLTVQPPSAPVGLSGAAGTGKVILRVLGEYLKFF